MNQPSYTILEHRAVLMLAGPDVRSFLQGIVSNDVERVSTERALWSAFLTPQGKFLYEFFLVERPGAEEGATLFWLECEAERRTDLMRRLKMYKLRAKVELSDTGEELAVAVLFGPGVSEALGLATGKLGRALDFAGGVGFLDPRLGELGARALLPRDGAEAALQAAGFTEAGPEAYDGLRIGLGVPDGSRDLEVERSILLENGFDELGGVDWAKGCFIGQELTARTKHRALIKKRLLPVEIEGPAPPEGSEVSKNGRPAGVLRSVAGDRGLALLRLERLAEESDFTAGEARLLPRKPDWAEF